MQPWACAAQRHLHISNARMNLAGSNWPAGSKHDRRPSHRSTAMVPQAVPRYFLARAASHPKVLALQPIHEAVDALLEGLPRRPGIGEAKGMQ